MTIRNGFKIWRHLSDENHLSQRIHIYTKGLMLILSACGGSSTPAASAPQKPAAADNGKTSEPAAPQKEKAITIGIVNAPITVNQINDQGDSASDNVIALLNDLCVF